MSLNTLITRRMELVVATTELVEADHDDPQQLAALLNARIGERWPTEYWDPPAMEWTIRLLREQERPDGWGMWYWVLLPPHAPQRTLIGHGGFKGPPLANGEVEIGYAVASEYRRRGLAVEASGALMTWAFQSSNVHSVAAETFPNLTASIGVMKKLGMTHRGEGSEPGAIRYGVTRALFQARQESQR